MPVLRVACRVAEWLHELLPISYLLAHSTV